VDYEFYPIWNDVAKFKISNNHLRQQKVRTQSQALFFRQYEIGNFSEYANWH
jgi:hypothetical protein